VRGRWDSSPFGPVGAKGGAKRKERGFAPYPTDLKRVHSGGFLSRYRSFEMTGKRRGFLASFEMTGKRRGFLALLEMTAGAVAAGKLPMFLVFSFVLGELSKPMQRGRKSKKVFILY